MKLIQELIFYCGNCKCWNEGTDSKYNKIPDGCIYCTNCLHKVAKVKIKCEIMDMLNIIKEKVILK